MDATMDVESSSAIEKADKQRTETVAADSSETVLEDVIMDVKKVIQLVGNTEQ